jgi:DNA-binding protein YbaB
MTVPGTDDDEMVRITVDGHGDIVEVKIEDRAIAYPDRLGAQITIALTRARKLASRLNEGAREKYLSKIPAATSLQELVAASAEQGDYHFVDRGGTPEMRNKIAEAIESLLRIADLGKGFQGQVISRNIGAGVGTVQTDVAVSRFNVTIDAVLVKQIGAKRLSGQVSQALREVVAEAGHLRLAALDEICVNGSSLGERLRFTEEFSKRYLHGS